MERLKTRVITGFLWGVGFLLVVYLGGIWYTTLVFFLATLAYYELIRMNHIRLMDWHGLTGLVFLWLLLFPNLVWEGNMLRGDAVFLFVLLFLFITVASKNRVEYQHVAYLLFSSFYLGIGFHFMNETRIVNGLAITLAIVFSTWATDTGAYFVGKARGKTKLWPAISPNKTIEGSLGGVVLAVVTMIVFSFITDSLTISQALIIGLVISVSGQIGDLMESAIKRTLNVKDSGSILPGHGGVLDRLDSLIVVFPVLHLLQLL
ncbi:phosphatidate cytidylyltransferase [Aneurinibacillus aneurinilyticus]|uniref:Phosphatidate cytidylyltransferase n=1 Tax=Aneurinibacillus aneurinilyticus ATCC 12856 TaxID=649747 RepID=U1X2P9_ANEAE|nr:phosphatidate cytidylyltransferase [Aneurinibacillus aneurinilyticus]ERI09245.1 phosphatidate cytidylyltransferase [Aneurinibacillus aneurinilyticus ATCC 12856]MED0724793.1 phosphatidate cytidylyltransferase [Aneurinibacillus aneurinilyticus]MED0733243.1 phosphatidate cytidylyltransferase [Aneurinibacillus aneurinilyticus]